MSISRHAWEHAAAIRILPLTPFSTITGTSRHHPARPAACMLHSVYSLPFRSIALALRPLLLHHCVRYINHISSRAPTATARLALNHSTHVEGLLPVLRRLIATLGPPDIYTIVPGRVAVTRGKAIHFRVRVSAPTPQGYKALARRGQTVQEVFITGSIGQAALQRALDAATSKELGESGQ